MLTSMKQCTNKMQITTKSRCPFKICIAPVFLVTPWWELTPCTNRSEHRHIIYFLHLCNADLSMTSMSMLGHILPPGQLLTPQLPEYWCAMVCFYGISRFLQVAPFTHCQRGSLFDCALYFSVHTLYALHIQVTRLKCILYFLSEGHIQKKALKWLYFYLAEELRSSTTNRTA